MRLILFTEATIYNVTCFYVLWPRTFCPQTHICRPVCVLCVGQVCRGSIHGVQWRISVCVWRGGLGKFFHCIYFVCVFSFRVAYWRFSFKQHLGWGKAVAYIFFWPQENDLCLVMLCLSIQLTHVLFSIPAERIWVQAQRRAAAGRSRHKSRGVIQY